MKAAAIVVGFFVVLLGLDWIIAGNNFFMYKYFAPREESVRRDVYEHTRSYRNGSIQRLNTLCTQVASADDNHKGLIYDVINHEFVEWDMSDVPGYLQSCLVTARKR